MSLRAPRPQSDSRPFRAPVVAVVDAGSQSRQQTRQMLESAGYRVVEYATGQSAIRGNGNLPSVYCIDLDLPDVSAVEVVKQLHERDSELSLLVVGESRDSPAASWALVAGAYDALVKPLTDDVLLHAVRRASERRSLVCGIRRLETELRERAVVSTLIGDSSAMRELARQVARASDSDASVCVFGERGTGKELVARAIHGASRRKCGPLVVVDCDALAVERHAVELFGQQAPPGGGAFRPGRVAEARGGTLYLSEVQALGPEAQAGLKRLIREGVTRAVGSSGDRPADVRVVCGTSAGLSDEAGTAWLDADLLTAITGEVVHVAPLRQRRADIPLLVEHFLGGHRKPGAGESYRLSPEVLEALTRHSWPGNARELQDVLVRSQLACRGDEITLADLPAEIRRLATDSSALPNAASDDDSPGPDSSPRVVPLRELERRAIESALKATRGSVGKAARLLGIGRATLYRRLASLELQRRPEPPEP